MHATNKAWKTELRLRISALMDSKLAKQIGPEEYAAKRKIANEEAAECKRRGNILADNIWSRRETRKR